VPTVVNQGLSPWSREFTRQVEGNAELRAWIGSPSRVESVNPAFAGFAREVDARALEASVFRPYRWVRLSWRAGSDPLALAERLRSSGLFDHVQPEPRASDRHMSWHQSSTITDPLYTNASPDPHRRQWAIDQARFMEAFQYTEGRVLVGVPDTGINPDHPDLLAAQRPHQRAALVRYTPGGGAYEEMQGLEQGFFPQTSQLNADLGGQLSVHNWIVGHGLHVAGLIAATKNNAEGGVGGCPGCGLAVIRFADVSVLPAVWQALGPSFGSGVISMSFAANYLDQLMLDTLTALNDRDVALVASIGNEARKRELASAYSGRSAFPGYLPFVIGVGGTDRTGERWHEHTIIRRPLNQRHPQLWWEAVIDSPFCGLELSGLGLTPPQQQWLPVDSGRDECGSNWGRETRSVPFVAAYTHVSPPVSVTLPAGQYGLDLMAPAAQVLAPLDRTYARYPVALPPGTNLDLLEFPCGFAPGPECDINVPGLNTAPGTNFIANSGAAMGANVPGVSFAEIPSNAPSLGYPHYGTLTGTSMAAPLVAAAVGLVRSANPLVGAAAVHDLLRCTATPMSNSEVWSGDPVLNPNPTINATIRTELTGSGRLNAEAAVRRTLGTVGGQTLRNRLIPMFSLTTDVGAPRTSWLFTTSPQVAMSGMVGDLHRLTDPALPDPNQEEPFDPDGPGPLPMFTGNPLPNGTDSPPQSPQNDVGTTEGITYVSAIVAGIGKVLPSATYVFPGNWPKAEFLNASASFLVFSTPYDPVAKVANGLVPLHRMSMKCSQYRHHYYTTTAAERAQALAGPAACSNSSSLAIQGYHDDGIEGYVHSAAAPQPAGTVTLRRGWLPSVGNWVLFTADEEALGKFPGVQQVTTLGFVYPAVTYSSNGTAAYLDSDMDRLPDAFEKLIGLQWLDADTDGDGRPDGEELPFAAPGVSDPAISDTVVPCVP
jgi:subtilisin family serine protease